MVTIGDECFSHACHTLRVFSFFSPHNSLEMVHGSRAAMLAARPLLVASVQGTLVTTGLSQIQPAFTGSVKAPLFGASSGLLQCAPTELIGRAAFVQLVARSYGY